MSVVCLLCILNACFVFFGYLCDSCLSREPVASLINLSGTLNFWGAGNLGICVLLLSLVSRSQLIFKNGFFMSEDRILS
jgi:hypothetical protein